LALSGPTAWDATSGVLTRISFLVLPGVISQAVWPLAVLNGTLAREDGSVESVGGGTGSIARAPQQPRFTSSITFNGQTPRLTLQGDNGASYLIEASSDLHNWDRVGVAITSTGTVVIDDPAGAGATSRYYRATFQP
jgi:hypothetical protein